MTRLEIFNLALAYIGEQLIDDPDGANAKAEYCRVFYDPCRKALLRAIPWGFARKVQALALTTDDPVGYEYAYQLPGDYIRIRHLTDSDGIVGKGDYPWLISGDRVWTDLEDAYAVYTYDVEATNRFDPLFVRTLAFQLAAEVVVPIKPQDMKKQSGLYRAADYWLTHAKYIYSLENAKAKATRNPFVEARS